MNNIDAKDLKILVVDDHPLFRKAISQLLINLEGIEHITEASNGQEALELCQNTDFDFIFLDLDMPVLNGEEVTKILKKEKPYINIIIITMMNSRHEIIELLNLGVNGFILKSTDEDELKRAINLILDGNQYLTPEVQDKWIEYFFKKRKHDLDIDKPKFSEREMDIIKLIIEQNSTREIVDKLCITESTINTHKNNIMKKMNVENSVGIALYAIKNGLYIP